jgi:feruloyl-CoA synthase
MNVAQAPFRNPGFAPSALQVTRTDAGEVLLSNRRPYDRTHRTMTSALTHWAAVAPDRVWLAERSGKGWRHLTFGEARERATRIAGGLRSLGPTDAGPLLIMARNGIEHALLAYAAMSQGIAVAPVSHRYGMPGANLTRLVRAVEVLKPAAVYVDDAATFAHGLSVDALADLPVIAGRNGRSRDISLSSLHESSAAAFTARPEDPARYLLTSGSTGLPKAVVNAHSQVSLNVAQVTACFAAPVTPPVMLHAAPWNHTMGLSGALHMSLHRGGTLYIDSGQPTAAQFGDTVRNLLTIEPTFHSMVPTGWQLLANELENDPALARQFFARVRLLQYSGAGLAQSVADRVQAVAVRTVGHRISFSSAYGTTETGPSISNVHWINARMGLIGLPVPGTTIKLAPVEGKFEVRVKGPQVTQGYLGDPQRTATAFDEEGYYRVGDAARFVDPDDPAQGLQFDGRLSENFKLSTGTFVVATELRVKVVGAIGPAVTDAVVCGENQAGIGLLLYPNPDWAPEDIAEAVRGGIERFNAQAGGSSMRIARATVLAGPPDHNAGEITDKSYVAQTVARRLHAPRVQALYADAPPADVMVFEAAS